MEAILGLLADEGAQAVSSASWFLPWCLLTFLVSLALSLFLTPVMIDAAKKYNIVDYPDGDLKNHKKPTPYLGGLGIYIAFVVTLGLLLKDFRPSVVDGVLRANIVLGLLSAGSMILILGLIDDFGALTPFIKFLGQFLAAFILYKSDIRIQIAMLPEEVNMVLSLLWIVGICNAFNIIDIMDGLAAGVAVIAAVFLFIMAVINSNPPVISVTILALTGAIMGFLRFNYHPAKIYMGDTGSMFIGLMLGSMSMLVSYTNTNPLAFLAPVLILGIPIFDTLFVMFHRFRRGESVFKGSPDHFALKLRRRNGSTRKTVNICYGATALLCISGLALIFLPGLVWPLVLIGIYILVIAPLTGLFLSRLD